jgi:hypothetical protein
VQDAGIVSNPPEHEAARHEVVPSLKFALQVALAPTLPMQVSGRSQSPVGTGPQA